MQLVRRPCCRHAAVLAPATPLLFLHRPPRCNRRHNTSSNLHAASSTHQRQPVGLLAIPDLTSPDALRGAWRRQWRPALEARVSSLVLAAADDASLLAALDAALALLRDVLALAGHCAARCADGGWRAAAAEVDGEARKYQGESDLGGERLIDRMKSSCCV